MQKLLTAIKDAIQANEDLSEIQGKCYLLEAPKPKAATSLPYAVVTPFPVDSQDGFAEANSKTIDTVLIQISVFAVSQHAADVLIRQLKNTFHNTPITLSDNQTVKGYKKQSGILREPNRLADDTRVFHSFIVFQWMINDL